MAKLINKEEAKVLTFWTSLLLIIILILVVLRITFPEKFGRNYTFRADKNYQKLTDYNRYYTVQNMLIKYYSYINEKDYDSILTILNDDYIKDNNITKDNIENILPDVDSPITFKTTNLMCVKNYELGMYSYLIKGKTKYMNKIEDISDDYYEVIVDNNNLIFSVKPITEDIYGGNCNE